MVDIILTIAIVFSLGLVSYSVLKFAFDKDKLKIIKMPKYAFFK